MGGHAECVVKPPAFYIPKIIRGHDLCRGAYTRERIYSVNTAAMKMLNFAMISPQNFIKSSNIRAERNESKLKHDGLPRFAHSGIVKPWKSFHHRAVVENHEDLISTGVLRHIGR